MYEWRKMSEAERTEVLRTRKGRKLPWHSPPHIKYEGFVSCIFTAACYEHAHIVGQSLARMAECENTLLDICEATETKVSAWCILPNHYHLLIRARNFEQFKAEVKLFHGRSARNWNLQDSKAGRKVWRNFFDRRIKSDRHFWASLNYINHNPVHHRYTDKWQNWLFSSAEKYLASVGQEKAAATWREYPILDYGKGWDEA